MHFVLHDARKGPNAVSRVVSFRCIPMNETLARRSRFNPVVVISRSEAITGGLHVYFVIGIHLSLSLSISLECAS